MASREVSGQAARNPTLPPSARDTSAPDPELSHRTAILLGVLLVIHVVLAWMVRAPAISWGEDDAVYSLLARQIASGGYREFWIVDGPIHSRYPPGLPVLLAMVNAVFGERLDAQLGVLTLCSAASLLLLFDAARRHVSTNAALFATGILAVNPLWIVEAGQVMTEAPFRLFLVVTVWAVSLPESKGRHDVIAGAAAVFASLVRTAGVAAIAALALHWAMRRQWKHVVGLALAAIPTVAWLAWSITAPAPAEAGAYVYVATDGTNATPLSLMGRIASNAWLYARRDVPSALAFFGLRANPLDNVLWAGLAAVFVPIGFLVLWRRWRFLCLMSAMYGSVLLLWPYVDPRFASPGSGFVLLVIAAGMAGVGGTRPWPRRALFLSTAALFLVGAWQQGSPRIRERAACDRARPSESAACLPETHRGLLQLAEFARATTPGDALFFAPKPAAFFVHSGRRSIRDQRMVRVPPDSLGSRLERAGVTYAVATPVGINRRVHNPQIAASCRDFELVRAFIGDAILLRLRSEGSPDEQGAACGSTARWRSQGTDKDAPR